MVEKDRMEPEDLKIINGSLILKDRIADGAAVHIRSGRIVPGGRESKRPGGAVINARGCYISPGFIDSHIHGEPSRILRNEIKNGTTSIVVAQSCAPLEDIYRNARKINEYVQNDMLGPSVIGLRLEGPYINSIKAGAQNRRYIRPPDKSELSEIIKRSSPALKMMTVAPEEPGALMLVRMLVDNGILGSIGHSNAVYREAKEAFAAGISHATHLFNAMRQMDSREPGVVGAVFSDEEVWAEVILDLVHVHKSLFQLLVKAKGTDRLILVTDSVAAERRRGVSKSRGAFRFRDGRLAGSCLTMIRAVENAVVSCGLDLPCAIRLATLNPARLFGVDGFKGSIEEGKDADLVVFDKKFDIKMVAVRGKIMFRKRGF